MKRLLILFMLIFLLSGCKYNKYDNGSSQISSMNQIDTIISEMIDESNLDNSTMGPHDMLGTILTYNDGSMVILSVWFNVNTDFDGEIYTFDVFGCQDYEGELLCHGDKDFNESTELKEELNINYAFDLIANVDVTKIVNELKETYSIYSVQTTYVHIFFEDFNEESINLDELENTVLYYDDAFHYEGVYVPESLMIRVRVDFVIESKGEMFYVYLEIE